MNHAGSFPDYNKFETLPCYFSTNAYGTPRTTVGGVQCDNFFQAIGVAVAENVYADIGPNLQDENLDIALNLQDENVEDERLDHGAPTGTDAYLDIGLSVQDENVEDEGLDHGAPPSHASPGATVTEDRHHKTLHTIYIEVNINYDGTCPLSELWEATKRDFEAKFNESMANRKRSIGDAAVGGDAVADSSKKKLKIGGDATAGGSKKLKIGGDAAAGGSKKKLNVIGDVDAPRPVGRSLAMRLQNATPAPPHPAGRRNLVLRDQHKSN
ncbi:uncharacterized protein LOC110748663 [Prunus avium]|uniref:Uncharacterized protein LOC110748663 n=1 Tax=Prunus avium TaxID=42229 RepID=A0A6P5RMX0_PRUAV|nr:uncharacterized protein LOC110748663 [Prunus avium]